MPGGVEWLIILAGVIIPLVLWVSALIEIVRQPSALWTASGQNQTTALLLIILLPLIGLIIYWVVIRPKLGSTARN